MRTHTGAPQGLIKLPAQLGTEVRYSVSLVDGEVVASKDDMQGSFEDDKRSRPDVLARTLADQGTTPSVLTSSFLAPRLSCLSDAQLDEVEETFRTVTQFSRTMTKNRWLDRGIDPFDFFLEILNGEFDSVKLRYIREFASLGKSLPGIVTTCMALKRAEVEVTEENILTHLDFAQKLTAEVPNVWITAESDGPQYYAAIVQLVHEHRDRVDDIISFFKERGALDGIEEYLAADQPMASGLL